MDKENLLKEYLSLQPNLKKIYVVPLINFQNKNSDYLYLFYKDFLEDKDEKVKIISLSAFSHFKFFISQLEKDKVILHYHWLEIHDLKSLLGIFWKFFWIIVYKISGGKLIWTIHNKFPHSNNFEILNRFFRKTMASFANKLHVHCPEAVDIMSPVLNQKKEKFFIVDHPYFPADILPKDEARENLSKKYSIIDLSNRKLFLMFGAIADYKGIIEAADLFINSFKDNILIIAGGVKKWDKYYYRNLLEKISRSTNIILIAKTIPDEDIKLFFNSSDYILFNYKDILTSGGIMMALSYNKKIIAPETGCIKNLDYKNIYKFKNYDELKLLIEKS